jgi:peptidoglycan hydrolase CwlO-like protein
MCCISGHTYWMVLTDHDLCAVQSEQNTALQGLQDTKQRLTDQLQRMTADRDRWQLQHQTAEEQVAAAAAAEAAYKQQIRSVCSRIVCTSCAPADVWLAFS